VWSDGVWSGIGEDWNYGDHDDFNVSVGLS